MGDEKPKGVLAVTAEQLAKPVYKDVARPLAKETGLALGAAGSFVRIAVRPFQTFALGMHLAFDWLDDARRKKFEGVPVEKVVEPPANIAGPLMLAAGFTSEADADLRELYAQLLSAAIHVDTRSKVHPAFVEILRQLTPAEARLLKPLSATNTHPAIAVGPAKDGAVLPGGVLTGITPDGLDPQKLESEMLGLQNLQRLGVVQFDFNHVFVDEARYEAIQNGPAMTQLLERLAAQEIAAGDKRGMLKVTEFGRLFLRSCLAA